MRHAMYLTDLFAPVKVVIYLVAVCLQITFEAFQHFQRSFPSAAFLVIEDDYLIDTILLYPVVPFVRSARFILIQHAYRCFIAVQIITFQHFFFQRFI